MADIRINNNAYKEKISKESTINETLDYILDSDAYKNYIITDVSLDGKSVTAEEEVKLLESTLDNYKNVEFELKSRIDLAFEALNSSTTYIDNIVTKIKTMSTYYRENNIDEGNQLFVECIDTLDLFIQLISNIQSTIKDSFNQEIETYKTIQNLEIHLLSVLKALLPAKENQDIIMLCDLLEYELIDNLTQWKIVVIPELKKIEQSQP